MKAVVMYSTNGMPQYTDFAEPQAQNDDEIVLNVKAVAVKHLDKSKAGGTHYTSQDNGEPQIVGSDGVAVLPDGRHIYGIGINGTMAEKALFRSGLVTLIPEGLKDEMAAALPNAVMGSAMALRFRAGLADGETVLINGATGFTGKMAVQLAKHYGAGKIIVTGRNEESLYSLLKLGADEVISLKQSDASFISQVKKIHSQTPVNIVIDYLWGHTAGLILSALKGNGSFSPKTRYVNIGAMTGDTIQLSSQILRGTDIQISGSGLGSWTKQELGVLFREILPEVFQLAAARKIATDVIAVPITDISKIWEIEVPNGGRLVVTI